MLSRREIATVLGAAALGVAVPRAWPTQPLADIRDALFAGRTIEDGGGLLTLDAPERAYDAAVVPITALVPQTPERFIRTVSLIVDNNPAPLAVTFHLRPEAGRADLGARVRVNEYTNVRAVAETSDGRLWMVERFVKAAGGCSAPSSKDAAAAMARLGKMKLKPLGTFLAGEVVPVELLVSHPQYTGMQIDQVTQLDPARSSDQAGGALERPAAARHRCRHLLVGGPGARFLARSRGPRHADRGHRRHREPPLRAELAPRPRLLAAARQHFLPGHDPLARRRAPAGGRGADRSGGSRPAAGGWAVRDDARRGRASLAAGPSLGAAAGWGGVLGIPVPCDDAESSGRWRRRSRPTGWSGRPFG